MPPTLPPARRKMLAATSRLGRSLLRLHDRMEQTRAEEARVDRLFRTWERSWSSSRDELSRRLQFLEEQLARLPDEPEPSPRLAVVHYPPDAAEMEGM